MVKGHIIGVKPNSIAEELEIEAGDQLIEVNEAPLGDIIDYFLATSDEEISLTIQKKNDDNVIIFDIEKAFGEDVGIMFDPPTITPIKQCANNCKFCFIRQMPKGMRPSLYVRDDDYRLSFLFGSYITGTNLSLKEIDRICSLHLSPLYISIHRTDDERTQLIGFRKPFSILDLLKRFLEAGIEFHTQIVLCPDENDGDILRASIEDLIAFAPNLLSLAIVPVGLTQFRDQLPRLRAFTKQEARDVIEVIYAYNKPLKRQYGKNIIYGSDEFYLLAEQPVPQADYYDEYVQLENGVGMVRLFENSLDTALETYGEALSAINFQTLRFVVATGTLAAPFLETVFNKISTVNTTFSYQVRAIQNNYFGSSITVSGLITSQDIIEQLAPVLQLGDILLIPENMLKFATHLFLDDQTVEDVEKALNVSIHPVVIDGEQLIKEIIRCGVS